MSDDPTPDPNEALAHAAAAGDREALEALLCSSLPELRALVERRTGRLLKSRMTETDIVQSVCREILSRGATFQHPSANAFRRWLYTTTMRKLSNRRSDLVAEKRDALREQALEAPDGGPAELTDGEAPSPVSRAIVTEELDRLERALAELPDEYRQVIVLAKIGGHSREEIAAEMGRSAGSVRMLLHRALARLAVVLEEGEEHP